MRRPAVLVGVAAATLLLPDAAHAVTATFTDPVGDAKQVRHGKVTEGVTGDSDITGLVVRARSNEGDELGVRLRVQVREIDRYSSWRERDGTGLKFRASFTTDNGTEVVFEGRPWSHGWSYADGGECAAFDEEPSLPRLHYGRYSDTITLDMPGECFAGAETVSVVVRTTLHREQDRLVDRVASSEPVAFGQSEGGSSAGS